jgi:hypothetical protein
MRMSYHDRLVSVYFKTAQDGRKLFFPWTYWGRGYVISSEPDYERLRRQLKTYRAVSLVWIITVCAQQNHIAAFVIAALGPALYAVWTRYLVAGLETTDEKLSLQECWTSLGRAFDASTLWLLEIAALAFVVIGIVVLVVDKNEWPLALVTIVFFGFGAVEFAYLLVLQKRSMPPPS